MAKSFIERVIDRVMPLDPDYKKYVRTKTEYLAARRDLLREQGRIAREANDAILQEQAEKIRLEKVRKEAWHTVATYSAPSLEYETTNRNTFSIDYDLVLFENQLFRKIDINARYSDGEYPVTKEEIINKIKKFSMGQDFWIAWFHPWLEGSISLKDLKKLKGFRIIGDVRDE